MNLAVGVAIALTCGLVVWRVVRAMSRRRFTLGAVSERWLISHRAEND